MSSCGATGAARSGRSRDVEHMSSVIGGGKLVIRARLHAGLLGAGVVV
jgi:hypothetical protein